MESAAIRRPAPLPGLTWLGLIGLLLAFAAVAWVVTGNRMEGMDAGPGTDPGDLGFYVTAWVVMMAAMMFPSVWPVVAMQIRMQAGKREQGQTVQAGRTPAFIGGYLVTWTAAGLAFYGLFKIGSGVWPDSLSWDRGGPYVAGGVLALAAVYQLTPLKNACLTKCRSPMAFLLTAWRPGRLGALRMGVEHGAWCVGCCWGLMAALFALGVMSIGWMVFVAALIATEKLLPWRAVANYGVAVLLLVLAVFVSFSPSNVPGLTLPGSAEARGHEMHQGGSMGGESMDRTPMKDAPMHRDMSPRPMPGH